MRLSHTQPLPDGTRVRVRLPQARDRAGLIALHERLGAPLDDMQMARTLRFDPRERLSVCATVLHGVAETLVAYGHVERDGSGSLIVADELFAPGVGDVVAAALAERAERQHVA